jgi:hypothetical protein
MPDTMAKKKSDEKPLSRPEVKYVVLPRELWDELKEFADADERPVNWVARKAIREFLRQQKDSSQ